MVNFDLDVRRAVMRDMIRRKACRTHNPEYLDWLAIQLCQKVLDRFGPVPAVLFDGLVPHESIVFDQALGLAIGIRGRYEQ
jgi:hypothetical protein